METQKILVALLGLLIVVAAFQMMQINKLNDKISGKATAASSNDAYAQMMKDHHGIDVNAQSSSASSGSSLDSAPNMVGGC